MRDRPYSKSLLVTKATLTSFIPGGNFTEYCAIESIVSEFREDRSASLKSHNLPIPFLYLLSVTVKSNALKIGHSTLLTAAPIRRCF